MIHQSNRLEVLAARFAALIASLPGSALAPRLVITPNYGMGRWLWLKTADQLGIAANFDLRFPAEFSWQMLRAVLGDLPDVSPFAPGVLRWRLFSSLRAHAGDFPELSSNLAAGDARRALELAEQIESVFDAYLYYRPDLIERWSQGKGQSWEARLWRLLDDGSAPHWVNLRQAFLDRVGQRHDRLPESAIFFGVSELSPGYLQLLDALSQYMDIHFLVVNPCQEYWGDIVDDKRRLTAHDASGAVPDEVDCYLETGNPLLASLGRQGRDFLDLLLDLHASDEALHFEAPGRDTLLAHLQSDMLELRDPRESPSSLGPDDSIRIHSCHSLMREAEVLHDQILDLLDQDPALRPEDIVIMTPDIDKAGPWLEAVFSTSPQAIPCSIADRGLAQDNGPAELLQHLLSFPGSRFDVNRVLELLEFPDICAHFGIDPATRQLIVRWCEAVNIRWGIDAEHRRSLELPATPEHTWRQGLDRLLLGYMLGDTEFFGDVLAWPEIEGSGAAALGRFARLARQLFHLDAWQQDHLPLDQWIERLNILLDTLLGETPAQTDARQQVSQTLRELLDQYRAAGCDEPLDFATCRHVVDAAIQRAAGRTRFLSGGVTVCELRPMRSLPFAVVCLMGMNDGEFPRPDRRPAFDRMTKSFRRGDRSPRNADRYQFLEALLSARSKLLISYTGMDIQSNEPRPPSVLVSELLDYLHEGYGIDRKSLIVQHPLQAFSPRYTAPPSNREPGLFTYADYRGGQREPEQPPIPAANREQDDTDIIELAELRAFLANPVRYYLVRQLGVALERQAADLDDHEPFAIEAFTDERIRRLIDEFGQDSLRRLRAEGHLPHGTLGDEAWRAEKRRVETLRQRLPDTEPLDDVEIQLKISGYRLTGVLTDLYPQGRIVIRWRRHWARERLPLYLDHLLLCASPGHASQPVTHLITIDSDLGYGEVPDPVAPLEALVEAYLAGRKTPLPLFPRSSYEFAKQGDITKARQQWLGNRNVQGEGDKPCYALAFRDVPDPLGASFQSWAQRLYEPLIEAEKAYKERGK